MLLLQDKSLLRHKDSYPEDTPFTRPRALLILAYLSLNPQQQGHKENLIALCEAGIQGMQGVDTAKKSLGEYISKLRKETQSLYNESGVIYDTADLYSTAVDTDIEAFKHALEIGDLREAERLYSAPFMSNIERKAKVIAGSLLHQWIQEQRNEWHAKYVGLLVAKAVGFASQSRWEEAHKEADRAYKARCKLSLFSDEEPDLPAYDLDHDQLFDLHALLKSHGSARAERQAKTLLKALPEIDEYTVLAKDKASAKARLHVPNNLTVQPLCLGRNVQALELLQYVAHPVTPERIITLTGSPGVGKTTLALQVGYEALGHPYFRQDGVFIVYLEHVTQLSDVPLAIAQTMKLSSELSTQEPWQQLATKLELKHCLLILDNAEHLPKLTSRLETIYHTCPHVKILITSRRVLRQNGQYAKSKALAGLSFPPAHVSLEEAPSYSAVQLFMQQAKSADPTFRLNADTLPYVITICRALEGLPLGIELVTARLGQLSIKVLERTLQDITLLCDEGREDKHRSLLAAFELSWQLLSVRHQALLAATGIFQGGFDLEAFEKVVGGSVAGLLELVNASLLKKTSDEHYTFHPLIYECLAYKSFPDPDIPEKHARYYLHQLVLITHGTPEQKDAAPRYLMANRHNVYKAWDWVVENERWELLEDAPHALERFADHVGDYHAACASLEKVAQQASGDIQRAAQASWAWLLYRLDDDVKAEGLAQKVKAHYKDNYQEGFENELLFTVFTTLGAVADRNLKLDEAASHCHTLLTHAQTLGNKAMAAAIELNLGDVYRKCGKYDEAESYLWAAYHCFKDSGRTHKMTFAMYNLSLLYTEKSPPSYSSAYQCLQESMLLAKKLGAVRLLYLTMQHKVRLHIATNNIGAIDALIDELDTLFLQSIAEPLRLYLLDLKGIIELHKNVPLKAQSYFLEALALANRINSPIFIIDLLIKLVDIDIASSARPMPLSLKALDVLYHEVSHGRVTHLQKEKLLESPYSTYLSFSEFTQSKVTMPLRPFVEYYLSKNTSPLLGEEAGVPA